MEVLRTRVAELEEAGEQLTDELSQTRVQQHSLQSSLDEAWAGNTKKEEEMQQWLEDFVDLKVRHAVSTRS